jgi:hypothetical protein
LSIHLYPQLQQTYTKFRAVLFTFCSACVQVRVKVRVRVRVRVKVKVKVKVEGGGKK